MERRKPASQHSHNLIIYALLVVASILTSTAYGQTVRVDTDHATFIPNQSLGAGIDRMPAAAVEKYFSQPALPAVLAAGWQPVTYRQNTELAVEAWHWNPQGTWSDSSGKGYFTGSATPTETIKHSYGYSLPHRGFTRNDGTDTRRFLASDRWGPEYVLKSNPYLSKAFTGEDDSLHPQWVVIDLATPQPINALRIAWSDPYAKQYLVQYWTGDEAIKFPTKGSWVRDQENAHKVHIDFDGGSTGSKGFFSGPVTVTTFGSAQYQWHPTKEGGFPDPDGPAAMGSVIASRDTVYELPKASMTIIRGNISNPLAKTH